MAADKKTKPAPAKAKKVSKPKKVVITLQRERFDGKGGVIGSLSHNGKFLAYTLELEWQDNQRRKSCIPAGEYKLKFRNYGGYYERYKRRFDDHLEGMIEVQDVPNRSAILLHIGNRPKDTAGCILVGQDADTKNSIIYKSKLAYICDVYPYIRDLMRKGDVYLKVS